jgi:catechol 2,3-dioxygenase-like lactoylglutathione lyase family enzyme
MSEPPAPEVDCEQQHAALRVSDLRAAVDFYTKTLGFRLGFLWGDPPDYDSHASYRFVER